MWSITEDCFELWDQKASRAVALTDASNGTPIQRMT
jgi:hypothetical protein